MFFCVIGSERRAYTAETLYITKRDTTRVQVEGGWAQWEVGEMEEGKGARGKSPPPVSKLLGLFP